MIGVKLACVLLICACSSTSPGPGSGDPGSGDPGSGDPGSGTKTLYADIEVGASMVLGGSQQPSLEVVLARSTVGGPPVSGASVVFTAASNAVTLTEVGMTPGTYQAPSGFDWQPSWHVEISAGSDELEATVEVPGETTITSPMTGGNVAAGDVTVQWTDSLGATAQSVWADPGNGSTIVKLSDTGSGMVPVSATGVITIYRQDAGDLAGGVSGSLATATTSCAVYLTVQ
jgi:hypothetical protein